jgi:hypothetical protein
MTIETASTTEREREAILAGIINSKGVLAENALAVVVEYSIAGASLTFMVVQIPSEIFRDRLIQYIRAMRAGHGDMMFEAVLTQIA